MRLISQDGMIDVPYEQVSVEQKGKEIWCGYSSTMVNHCTGKKFAEYSTELNARKAIENLRKEYIECTKCSYQMGQCGNLYMNVGFVDPKVFRFPEEIELESEKKMTNDLISREEVISTLRKVFEKYNIGFANGNGGFADAVPRAIESIPIAYDINGAIENLDENSFIPNDWVGVSEDKMIMSEKAKEIIKNSFIN